MNALAPVFGNLHNFLHFVAFTNLLQLDDEQRKERKESTRREEQRLLFNAVVAFDCAVDYAFHETGGEAEYGSEQKFLQKLAEVEPALLRLREFSNAMKHHSTRRTDKLNAADLATGTISGTVSINSGEPKVSVELTTELIADAKDVVTAAWHYWHRIGQAMGRKPLKELLFSPTQAGE